MLCIYLYSIWLLVKLEMSLVFSPFLGIMFPDLISGVWSLYIIYQNILLLLSPLWILTHAELCVLYHSVKTTLVFSEEWFIKCADSSDLTEQSGPQRQQAVAADAAFTL